jgi:hypothetical protein
MGEQLSRETCPQCGQHPPVGWGSRWRKGGRRRKPTSAASRSSTLPERVHPLVSPWTSDPSVFSLSTQTHTRDPPRSFPASSSEWGCVVGALRLPASWKEQLLSSLCLWISGLQMTTVGLPSQSNESSCDCIYSSGSGPLASG